MPLRPLYTLPVGDHHAVVLSLPCGRELELVFYDGGGCCRSVGLWRTGGRVLGVVLAGAA